MYVSSTCFCHLFNETACSWSDTAVVQCCLGWKHSLVYRRVCDGMYDSLSSKPKSRRSHHCSLRCSSLYRRLLEWALCEPHGKVRSCDAWSNQHWCHLGVESSKNSTVPQCSNSRRRCVADITIRVFFGRCELFERSGGGMVGGTWLVTRHSLAHTNEHFDGRLYAVSILLMGFKALIPEASTVEVLSRRSE